MLEKFEIFDSKYTDDYICLKCTSVINKYNLMPNDILFLKLTIHKKGMIVYEYNTHYYVDELLTYDNLYKIVEVRRSC